MSAAVTDHPKTMRLKYVGPPKKDGKVVDLPIPFISKSEWRGRVVCNPIGEFEWSDGQELLARAPEIFVRVDALDSEGPGAGNSTSTVTLSPRIQFSLCQCGCGKSVSKEGNKFILGHSARHPKAPSQQQSEAEAILT